MPANELQPFFEPAERITGRCTAAVPGMRFVAPSATIPGGAGGTENVRVALAGAGAHALAVSCYDGAINEEIPLIRSHSIVPVEVGATGITAGTAVQSDATGRAIPLAAGAKLGVAVEDAGAVGTFVGIALNL